MRRILNFKNVRHNLKDKKFQRNSIVFFICLLISSVLWFANYLSKTYTYPIAVKIEYSSLPKGKIFAEQPLSIIKVVSKEVGFNIISKNLSANRVITLDLQTLKLKKNQNKYYGYLTSEAIIKMISSQSDLFNKIERVIPDTIFFVFTGKAVKKVPIKLDIEYKLSPQSDMFESIKILPDSVDIIAPADMLETITFVSTERKNFGLCEAPIYDSLKLQNPLNGFASLSVNRVFVLLPIEKFTEGKVSVPISDTTIDGNIVKPLPSVVDIIFLVPINKYNEVSAELFKAKLDRNIIKGSVDEMGINIIKYPSFVKISKIEPQSAEFIFLDESVKF